MNEPLRWGILGTGNIAAKFAAQLNTTEHGQLVATGSRTLASAEAFAGEHGGQGHGSYEQLVADPRVEASQDAYRQQGEMLTQIRSMLADIHQTVQQFRQVKTQLSGRLTALRGQTGSEALVQQGEAIVKQLAAWEQQLIQPSQKTFQDVINFPNRLNAQLVYLAGQLDTNDPQPTAGCQQRLADLTAQWTTEKAALEKIVAGPIAQFNQAYRAAELPALIIPDSNDK